RRVNASHAVAVGKQGTAARRASRPLRWNPDPEDVQKSVAQLVLTIVEFLRKLMERQAIRRMEQKTLTRKEVEAIGTALMRLEETIRDIGKRFGLEAADLNLDLGDLDVLASTDRGFLVWVNDGAGRLTPKTPEPHAAIDAQSPPDTWSGAQPRDEETIQNDAPSPRLPADHIHAPPVSISHCTVHAGVALCASGSHDASVPRAPPSPN